MIMDSQVVYARGVQMNRSCQYCSNEVTAYRMTLSKFNIGGNLVSYSIAARPAGIMSVYRHHPVAVCSYHYDNLPRHVRHYTNNRELFT